MYHQVWLPGLYHCQGGMFAKRYQYGIRSMAATTIHKAMGNHLILL
jgi:hypothetical protein